MAYVYSTLSTDQEYRGYREGGDVKTVKWSVTVKGGANIASKNLITPKGVLTIVSEEELALLNENAQFNRHKERGYIVIEKREEKAEKVAKNMKKKDESAPLTHSDFKPGAVEVVTSDEE